MRRGELYNIYRPSHFMNPKWTYKCIGQAKVLVVSDGYAMLRFPRAAPFVESVRQLEEWKDKPPIAAAETK